MNIEILRYGRAPDNLKALSQHGGDEDWIIVIPKSAKDEVFGYWPIPIERLVNSAFCTDDEFWKDYGYVDSFGHNERHVLKNGDVVLIFSHA